jgi:L-malate glycosyltransferase
MRLCFFDFNLNYGGGPQGSVYLARRLNALHEVHVIDAYGQCRAYVDAVTASGVGLHILRPEGGRAYIGGRGLRRFAGFCRWLPEVVAIRRRLVRLLVEIDPDVIWVNNEKSLVLLVSSLRLWRYPKAIYMRGWSTSDQISPLLKWLMKTKVSAVIAHAEAAIEELKKAGIPERKLCYVQNCIDVDELKDQADKGPSEGLPGMNRRPRILLAAARLTRQKGQTTAIRAVARLKEAGLDPALWLTGVTSVGVQNDYEEEVKALIAQHGLEENVFLVGWRKDIPALVKACDIVVLPTYTEGFPRSVLEAMHLNKPVCATPVGGVPEAIEDGVTGFLFDIEDDAALAEKIRTLVEQPEVRNRIVENAAKLVSEQFLATTHTERIGELFRTLQQKRKGPTWVHP